MRHPHALVVALSLVGGCATLHSPQRTGSTNATEQSPTERYEAFRATLVHAKTLHALLPFTTEAVRLEMSKRPPSYHAALLADLQRRKVDWLRVVDEEVSGEVASLAVEGAGVVDPAKGTHGLGRAKVVLLREGGVWRIDEETWALDGDDSTGITPRDWVPKK